MKISNLFLQTMPLLFVAGLVPATVFSPALAQSIANSFAGFSAARDEPVNIEADTLEVFDARKKAYFRGNVKVTQGKLTLRSKELEVTYTARGSNKKVAPGSPNAAVKLIRAKGRVVIDTPDNQSVTSKWALFDVQRQFITIGGDVVMSQGSNVMKGDKLLIDLKAGTSRLETGTAKGRLSDRKGRVRVILNPRDSGAFKKTGGAAGTSGAKSGSRPSDISGANKTLPWLRRKEEAEKMQEFNEALGQ